MKFDLCVMRYGRLWQRGVEILSVDQSFLENTIDLWFYIMVVADTVAYTNDGSATRQHIHHISLLLPLRTSYAAEVLR